MPLILCPPTLLTHVLINFNRIFSLTDELLDVSPKSHRVQPPVPNVRNLMPDILPQCLNFRDKLLLNMEILIYGQDYSVAFLCAGKMLNSPGAWAPMESGPFPSPLEPFMAWWLYIPNHEWLWGQGGGATLYTGAQSLAKCRVLPPLQEHHWG